MNRKFFNRLRSASAFILVFLLILATNRLDQQHFDLVQEKIASVYKDRILAQHYIYEMSWIVNDQASLLRYEGRVEPAQSARLDSLIASFSTTRLTTEEARLFERLQNQLGQMNALMMKTLAASENPTSDNGEVVAMCNDIRATLDRLSEIQKEESWNLKKAAQLSLDRSSFLSRMELWALAIIAVLIQIILFYRGSKE